METIYWVLAIGGSSLFFVKMILLLLGADGGHDAGDADFGDVHLGDSDAHDGGHGSDDGNSTAAFKLLTLQSLSAFSMGAGWMGLAALQTLGMSDPESVLPAVIVGCAFVGLLGFLLSKALSLESSGNLKPESAIGHVGNVYLTIPATGKGQVQIDIQGRLATMDATSRVGGIPTGARVRVDAVESDGTLVVSAA